jgi:hypothetical protein
MFFGDPKMIAINAFVRNGRIETEMPLDLPDGTVLKIPIPEALDIEPDWDTSLQAIEAWIERDKEEIPPSFDPTKWESAMSWLKECDRNTLEKFNRETTEMFP